MVQTIKSFFELAMLLCSNSLLTNNDDFVLSNYSSEIPDSHPTKMKWLIILHAFYARIALYHKENSRIWFIEAEAITIIPLILALSLFYIYIFLFSKPNSVGCETLRIPPQQFSFTQLKARINGLDLI